MKVTVAFGAIILGFALLVMSGIWSTLFPPTSSWTPQKAERMSEIKDRLNNLSFMLYRTTNRPHAGVDPGPLQAEHDQLLKEFEQLKVEFESAAVRPQTTSKIMKWSGISLAVVGLIGWYAAKNTS